MKSRFVGIISVTFPDGYVKKCFIRQRASKGKGEFFNTVSQYGTIIMSSIPKNMKGTVTFKYKGDFYQEIYELLKKAEEKIGETQLQTA